MWLYALFWGLGLAVQLLAIRSNSGPPVGGLLAGTAGFLFSLVAMGFFLVEARTEGQSGYAATYAKPAAPAVGVQPSRGGGVTTP